MADKISDSQFLLDINNVADQEMRIIINQVNDLVYKQLISSIDKTAKTISRVLLDTKQLRREKSIQHELESQEKKLQRSGLTEFVRDINELCVERGDS